MGKKIPPRPGQTPSDSSIEPRSKPALPPRPGQSQDASPDGKVPPRPDAAAHRSQPSKLPPRPDKNGAEKRTLPPRPKVESDAKLQSESDATADEAVTSDSFIQVGADADPSESALEPESAVATSDSVIVMDADEVNGEQGPAEAVAAAPTDTPAPADETELDETPSPTEASDSTKARGEEAEQRTEQPDAAAAKKPGRPSAATATDVAETSPDAADTADAPAEDEEEAADEPREPSVIVVWLKQSPPWLASMVTHAILLVVLALWALPGDDIAPTQTVFYGEQTPEEEKLEELEDEKLELPTEVTIDAEATEDFDSEIVSDQDFEVETDITKIANENDDLHLAAAEIEFDSVTDAFMTSGNVAQSLSGPNLSGLGGRTAEGRRMMAAKGGATRGSENAVEAALIWLARHQNPDGSWNFVHAKMAGCTCQDSGSVDSPLGATGFALLPFLGAGYTHMDGKKYEKTIHAGLKYLIGHMKVTEKGGSLVDGGRMYGHGIASIALSEAYGMTFDSELRKPAQLALKYICEVQSPTGGWGYGGPGRDTSVSGWQVMALKSGDLAGFKIPKKATIGIDNFLESVQMESGAYYGYTSPAKRPSTTSIGLLSRMLGGWRNDNPALFQGVKYIAEQGPSKSNMYYNYYATQVMFQYTSGEGPNWKKWNDEMRDFLVNSQERVGHQAGSWKVGGYNKHGGRVYSTCMAAMVLEVYYRHMPVYKEVKGEFKNVAQDDDFPLD